MRARWPQLMSATLLAVALSGCPMTDDYFIEQPAGGGSGAESGSGGNGAEGGSVLTSMAGTLPMDSGSSSGATAGTASGSGGSDGNTSFAEMGGAGGASCDGSTEKPCPSACVPTTERCNGHDDNCNDVIDEQACNSAANGTTGCSGFVLAARPNHGYMLCTGNTKDYAQAQEACQGQSMRLAWLESTEENQAIAEKVNAAVANLEVWIGANDIAIEGHWVWDGNGGQHFWSGDFNGKPAPGMFNAWSQGAPNNANNNEDCAVLSSGQATWGDRTCTIDFAYLCEEPEP